MKVTLKALAIGAMALWTAFTIGCASTTTVVVSRPAVQTATSPSYKAQFEPLKDGHNVFIVFRLTVENKTDRDLEIDWNKTQYLYKEKAYGPFVFEGIVPSDIKGRTIPPDIVPPSGTLTKIIAPYRLIARAPVRERDKTGMGNPVISAGPLPAGENGIRLVVRLGGKEVTKRMKVVIVKQEGK